MKWTKIFQNYLLDVFSFVFQKQLNKTEALKFILFPEELQQKPTKGRFRF